MNYRNNPELHDKLAAEYVVGTLRGRARQRFERLMREDAVVRRTVAGWEARLAPMAAAVAEVVPPPRLWLAIRERIAPAVTSPAAAGLWTSLNLWRALSLVSTGLAFTLLLTLGLRQAEIIRVPVEKIVAAPSGQMQASYVAMLTDAGGKVVFMAYAERNSDELWVKKVGMQESDAAHSMQLWGLPREAGAAPKSLGLVPAFEKGTMKLAASADVALKDFPALAISLEPAGGSKSGLPTGPVMYKGDCHKFW
jgi:anti-sigma-K factor RskA